MRILGRRSGTGVLRVEGYGDIGVGYQLEVCSDGGIKSAEGTMRGDMTKLMQAWFSGNDRQRLVLEEGTATKGHERAQKRSLFITANFR